MRNEALRELDRVTRGKVRPFRAIEAGQLWEVLEVNPGSRGLLEERLPRLCAWREFVFVLLQSACHRKTDEDYLTAPRAQFINCRFGVAEARLNGFGHFRGEYFFRHIAWRWGWSKERQPSALHLLLEWTGAGA